MIAMADLGYGVLDTAAGYFIRIDGYEDTRQCLVQDMAMDGERCSSGYRQYYVSNHPIHGSYGGQPGRAEGANAVSADGSGRWYALPRDGAPNSPPDGWRLVGMWGAGGGANGAYGGPDGPYGSSLMVPNSSTLEKTATGRGYFGENIFYTGGNRPLIGRLVP